MFGLAGHVRSAGPRRAGLCARGADRQRPLDTSRTARSVRKPTTSSRARNWRRKAPGLDWTAFLDAAGFGAASAGARFPAVGHRRRLARHARSAAAGLEGLSRVPLDPRLRPVRADGPRRTRTSTSSSRTLAGTPEMPAPWKTASAQTDQAIGHAVGDALPQGILSPPRPAPRSSR